VQWISLQEIGKRRIGPKEPEIVGVQKQSVIGYGLRRPVFQVGPSLATPAVAPIDAAMQLQEGYISLRFDPLSSRGYLSDAVVKQYARHLRLENPLDVGIPIGRDDRYLERLGQPHQEVDTRRHPETVAWAS
jgi:hypothetical protein